MNYYYYYYCVIHIARVAKLRRNDIIIIIVSLIVVRLCPSVIVRRPTRIIIILHIETVVYAYNMYRLYYLPFACTVALPTFSWRNG